MKQYSRFTRFRDQRRGVLPLTTSALITVAVGSDRLHDERTCRASFGRRSWPGELPGTGPACLERSSALGPQRALRKSPAAVQTRHLAVSSDFFSAGMVASGLRHDRGCADGSASAVSARAPDIAGGELPFEVGELRAGRPRSPCRHQGVPTSSSLLPHERQQTVHVLETVRPTYFCLAVTSARPLTRSL